MSALGATDSNLSALTTGTSQLGVSAPATPRTIEIPFATVFDPLTRGRFPFDEGVIANYTSLFESVQFVSLEFSVELTGQNAKLSFAATGSDVMPATNLAWLGSPIFQRFAGNAHGDTFADYRFPTAHPFGLEVKATTLGNPHPRFYFKFDGGSSDKCSIRGKFVVRGGGHGIIPATTITMLATNKSTANSSSPLHT
jgi:hypothetical protein